MAEVKRGRLHHVEIHPEYEEREGKDKGKIKGHRVEAHHDAEGQGKDDYWRSPKPIVDHVKSKKEAMKMAEDHLAKNEDEEGTMPEKRSMRSALGM